MNDFFLIAKIISTYGDNGFVRITLFSDFPERFFDLKKVFIDFFGNAKPFIVQEVKKQRAGSGKEFFLLKFENFNSEESSKALVGKEIFVDKKNVVKLPEDYNFVHDIIGSKVLRNNSEFGIVQDVLSFPANDVYVIISSGKEILIPAVKEFIESFDAERKILVLKPGDDLYENDED